VSALRPAEKGNHHSINSECLGVILVRLRYHPAKILSKSFVKEAMFVNRNYITNYAAAFAKNI